MTSPTSTPPPFTTTGSTLSTDKPVGDLPTAHYLGWEPHTHTSPGVCAAPIYRGCRCTARRCLHAPPCGSPKTEGGRNSSRMASWAPPRQKTTRRPTGPGRSELREAFIFFNTGIKPSRTAEKATTPREREMTLSSGKKKKKLFNTASRCWAGSCLFSFVGLLWNYGIPPGRSLLGRRHMIKT